MTNDNIVLDYRVVIVRGEETYFAKSVEFFKDEHGFQWAKFTPTNGYNRGHEHIVRAETIMIVREIKGNEHVLQG